MEVLEQRQKQSVTLRKSKIVILGGSFAGLTAALELKRLLKNKADVTVISRSEKFVYIPSLIWVVPGWRKPEQITFNLEPTLKRRKIDFIHAKADKIEPEKNLIITDTGNFQYDYLVIGTGPHFDWDEVSGMGPDKGHTQSVCSLPHAIEAGKSWKEFLKNAGPVVLGAAQYASCFGAEYEMVFNIDRALREAGIRDKAPVTFLTSEPFLGHFGIGGMGKGQQMVEWFFKKLGIKWITNAWIDKVTENEVHLSDGQKIPFKYGIIIPPFKGVKAVRDSPGLGDDRGFIPVNTRYQHTKFKNIYSAGVAIAVKPPEKTPIPCGVPKTGYMSEVMAKVAAYNIYAEITGKPPKELPFPEIHGMCIMDAGKQGVFMISDRILKPRKFELLIPGPWSHWAKILLEKFYIWKMKTGRAYLP